MAVKKSTKSAAIVEHPAVDSNPREGTTEDMNRIDFNDPTKTPEEVVTERLQADAADAKSDKK